MKTNVLDAKSSFNLKFQQVHSKYTSVCIASITGASISSTMSSLNADSLVYI